jgi:hypothetical protein
MSSTPTSAERYLELLLRFGKLVPDLIDSYSGPEQLAARVAAETPFTLDELAAQAHGLQAAATREPDDARRRWLRAQLAGLETACLTLAGKGIPYPDVVRRCYGVEAEVVADDVFAAAHARLDGALPGEGTLQDRYAAWLATQLVPAERVADSLEALAAELRARTAARFGLPDGDHVEFELVTGKSWSGHCEYLGGLRTRISINTDLPIASFRLFELVTHEVYPGHHTDHAHKERLIREHGRLELAVFLYTGPQALVAEGLAQMAHEALLGREADLVGAEVLRPLGVPYDAETAAVVRDAKEVLLSVLPNLAFLLGERRLSDEEARPYARRWMLEPDEYVDKAVGSLLTAAWRPYYLCYPVGLALCRRFVAGDPARFERLLTDQLTTEDLL